MPTAFRVTLENVPGALAKVLEPLAEKGINLEASSGETLGGEGKVTLITSDPQATRDVLQAKGVEFEEAEILVTTLEDRPGSLARVAGRLADAGVNITGLIQISRSGGRSELGFIVDQPDKARDIL